MPTPHESWSQIIADLRARATEVGLSTREQEIVVLVAEGFSNREIALRCYICEQTVKDHLKHIFAKLGVHQRSAVFSRLLGAGSVR